jgi:7-cyano-7-deazaguanine synthase in queuosine biosynthesis
LLELLLGANDDGEGDRFSCATKKTLISMEPFKPDVLVMLSGGIDSTGVFWQLAKQGRQIHVHHMNLINVERRGDAESRAVADILTYMKHVTKFVYSESVHVYPSFQGQFIWDSDLMSFIAGNICMATPAIKEVAIGLTATDASPEVSTRIERGNRIFSAFGTEAVKTYPLKELSKQQIVDLLPKELRSLTWSCRRPRYDEQGRAQRCDRCKTCRETSRLIYDR